MTRVDYRRLNQVSMSNAYPMPRVDELIDRVGKSMTLDLTRGYWQVPVASKDCPKTAFAPHSDSTNSTQCRLD